MPDQDLPSTFAALQARFRPGAVDRPITYYLSLGEQPGEKWTLVVSPTACEVREGKVVNADCVLKMPADKFIAMAAGRWQPGAMDVLSGKVKTSDIDLLRRLQQAFGL